MHVKKLINHIKKDEGSGLILALMTLMVLSILGAALGAITIGSYKLGDVSRDDNSAYYIAEAGANMAYEEMERGVQQVYEDSTEGTFFPAVNKVAEDVVKRINLNVDKDKAYLFESQFGEKTKATITIEFPDNGVSRNYKITSVGSIGNRTRTVEKNVTVTWITKSNEGPGSSIPPITTTVAKNSIEINNGVTITGTLHLDSMEPGSLSISEDVIIGSLDSVTGENDLLKVFVPRGADVDKIVETKNKKAHNISVIERDSDLDWEVYENLLKDFPNYPEVSETIPVDGIINTEGKNKVFIVDNLTSSINIIGNGRVDIYVKDEINLTNNVSLNPDGDVGQLQVFYNNNKPINIKNDVLFKGTLFSKNADFFFGNSLSLTGLFITGGENVSLGGGTLNTLFIAPNADVNYINNSKDNNIQGIMVVENIVLSNNLTLVYDDYYLKNFPLTLPAPDSDGSGYGSGSSGGGELIITEPGIEN